MFGVRAAALCQPENRQGAWGNGGLSGLASVLPPQQLRHLGEIDRQPPRLVLGEQIGRRASAGLDLIVEIAKLLSVLVADDEANIIHSSIVQGGGKRRGGMAALNCWGIDRRPHPLRSSP